MFQHLSVSKWIKYDIFLIHWTYFLKSIQVIVFVVIIGTVIAIRKSHATYTSNQYENIINTLTYITLNFPNTTEISNYQDYQTRKSSFLKSCATKKSLSFLDFLIVVH